jgi:5-methyltetrahydrofolate--homocysteine methyltransferase
MTHLLDYIADRVILCDGAIGTRVQALNLTSSVISRPWAAPTFCARAARSRPRDPSPYLAAGCDACRPTALGLAGASASSAADKAFDLNRRAAELARGGGGRA